MRRKFTGNPQGKWRRETLEEVEEVICGYLLAEKGLAVARLLKKIHGERIETS